MKRKKVSFYLFLSFFFPTSTATSDPFFLSFGKDDPKPMVRVLYFMLSLAC